jgi:transposase-like protein
MALRVVSMQELKLEVLLERERTGETVAEVCARHGISRASFYRYRRRYLEEGVAGLAPRGAARKAAHLRPRRPAAIQSGSGMPTQLEHLTLLNQGDLLGRSTGSRNHNPERRPVTTPLTERWSL